MIRWEHRAVLDSRDYLPQELSRERQLRGIDPFRFMLIAVSGWMNHRQRQVIGYLREENRVLREQLGDRRVRLDDNQRRRWAVKAKALGRKVLAEVASIVARDLVGLAPEADRPEIRWNGPSFTRSASYR